MGRLFVTTLPVGLGVSIALSAREVFDVALQPRVGLASGELAGFEALARFRDGGPPDVRFDDAPRRDSSWSSTGWPSPRR